MSSFWNQRTLHCYTPISTPELTFFYIPLTGNQQVLLRKQYPEFEFIYELMKYAFCERLFLFKVNDDLEEEDSFFSWPYNPPSQEALLENIPKSVVIEVGASILGWKRTRDETPKKFVNRILGELQVLRL